MYDIFISYRRDGGYAAARLLYERFKNVNLVTFLDLEELRSGQFNYKLYDAIEESANFVLVLSPNSLERCMNDGDWLRLEIAHAIKSKKNIVPIMLEHFEWPECLPDEIAALPTYNGIKISSEYFDASMKKLVGMLQNIKISNDRVISGAGKAYERLGNAYIFSDDKKERRRMMVQQNLMVEFDRETYTRVCNSYDELRVLDIGANTGAFVVSRIVKNGNVTKLVGLEYDKGFVNDANEKYAEEGRIKFFEQNVEDEDFSIKLEEMMEEMGVENFNVVNISMLILHLKSPYKMLKTIRKYLDKGATIIVKDIDDGLNIAYPDEDGSIQRVYEICKKSRTSGFRNSGRQIYTLLKRAGYNNVRLERMGIATPGMDYDERSALFDTYFSFILEELKIYVEEHPEDKNAIEDCNWYSKVYDKIEERFQDDNFFFNLGFVLLTAQKL